LRGGKVVSGRNRDAASLRARGIAALICGERPAAVARDLRVPEGTVRSWKHRTKNRGIATLKKGNFGALLTTHLETLIRSLMVDSDELSGRCSELGAHEMAITFGVLFDRTLRMIELHEAAWGRGGA
jgi:transposase